MLTKKVGINFSSPKRGFQGKLATRFCKHNIFSLEIRIAVNACGEGIRLEFLCKFPPNAIINIENWMLNLIIKK